MDSKLVAGYKQGTWSKLTVDCQKIIDIICEKVLAKKSDGESKALFVNILEDYARRIAENAKDGLLEQVK